MELSRSTARAKRSCAEKGYVTDAFAPMFSDDTHTRTDPIMHRGYYARFRGVDVAVRTFLSKFGDSAQLVVLGCGLDSMFWRLHATLDTPPTYFEVDSDVPTLVLCECVLAYLDPERGDALVAWSRRTFAAACLFVAYDVVAPKTGDAFGRVMLSNFKDRGAPLLGAAESLDAVRGRFGDYEASDVRDMRAVYEALVLRQPAELGASPARMTTAPTVDEHGEMKQEVYNLAAYAIEQYVTEMEVSKHIKAHFDQKYGPTWHCIVGSDFRAYVTHESKNFIFFYQGKTAICLYKCG
ncbi:protein C-terminal leucine carboxyl O-methyltransferase [Aureococcus anophagefferens]|nr:protein C-terminal leucine carboxyl O-methyltransferase [Aureococcus anophagefferens]